jgi:hypothetical protein
MTEAEGANAKDIGALLKLDRSSARRRLLAACDDGYIVNLEQRKGMPGKYRATGQKSAAAELNAQCLSPSESVSPCHRNEIAEASQSDNGGKPDLPPVATEPPMATDGWHGGERWQTPLATDYHLDGNEKSPPVARWHEFPGDRDTHATLAPDDGDVFPPVCAHCGAPATAEAPVLRCAVDGQELLLHRACQKEWLDVSIPPGLLRSKE